VEEFHMKGKSLKLKFILGTALFGFLAQDSNAMRLTTASQDTYIDFNLLTQIWIRHQDISDESNRANFIDAQSRDDIFIRRWRFRVFGSVNPWFKVNFVLRENDTARDPYDQPFGGTPLSKQRSNKVEIHELDAILGLNKLMELNKDIRLDAHIGYPRIPWGREQSMRVYDNLDLDRTFSTLRLTQLALSDVTGRSTGAYIHAGKTFEKDVGPFKGIHLDMFLGAFSGYKSTKAPWEETQTSYLSTTNDSNAYWNCSPIGSLYNCTLKPTYKSKLRGNVSKNLLYTFRGTFQIGDMEGRPGIFNWLYRDTYLGKRKGLTIGLSYGFQNKISQAGITDTQGIEDTSSNAKSTLGLGSSQIRIPYLLLPNPIQNPQLINNKVDLRSYGIDLAVHYKNISFVTEYTEVDFKNVAVDPANLNRKETFKNKGYYFKLGYTYIPANKVNLFEPYISYSVYNPDIKKVGNNYYGDFVVLSSTQNPGGVGKIKTTGIGINYYYKDERFRWTLEYTKNKESNYEIKNDAVTLMFQFIF
jgi:hypothetical protein